MKWTFHWTSSDSRGTVHLTVTLVMITGVSAYSWDPPHRTPLSHLTGTRLHVQKSTRIFPSSRGTGRPPLCLSEEQNKPGDGVSGLSRPPLGPWGDPVSSNAGTSRTNTWSWSWDQHTILEQVPLVPKTQAQQDQWMMGRSRKELGDMEASPSRLPVMNLS